MKAGRFVAMALLGGVMALGCATSWAACEIKGKEEKSRDQNVARIRFGRVNITNPHLQPPGTLLATTVVPPTNFTFDNTMANTTLWECDLADMGQVHFMVATNGDEKVGGFWDIGGPDGLSDVYATWYQYVGLRLTMAGVVLTRKWKAVPVTSYATVGKKARIRLSDVPTMVAELYRVSSLPPGSGARNDYCGTGENNQNMGKPSPTGTPYPNCGWGQPQPSAYIQFVGPGMGASRRDYVGEDSADNYDFWGPGNGFGYGMWDSGTVLSSNASCVVRNNTPVVQFPALSVQQLTHGVQAMRNFSVQIECADSVSSGVNPGQTAMGIQVSSAANHHALVTVPGQGHAKLGNNAGGITHLVADDYTNPNTAKGVGVTIQNPAMASGNLVFVGQPGLVGSGTPAGQNAGWYPVLAGATQMGGPTSGFKSWQHTFTATFGRVNQIPVTPGNFQATATILVKVQ